MSGDVMQMNKVKLIPLEAHAEVEFIPGGLHVMLIDLRKDLRVGEEIEVALHFRNSEHITVIAAVRDSSAPGENHPSEEH